MLTAALIKAFQVYGIAIAISAIVALLIKAMVSITNRLEKLKPVEVPLGEVCPIGPGVPEASSPAIAAAAASAFSAHCGALTVGG